MSALDQLGSGEVVVDNGDLDPTEREALLAFAAGPPVVIDNPFAAQPPRVGLLAAATDVTGILESVYGPHWLNGFQFEPELGALNLATEYPWFWQCPESGGTAWATVVNTATGASKKPVPAKPANVGVRPFVVNTADPCISTMGMFGRDPEGRAKRALEANLSRIAANELWTGTRSVSAGFQSASATLITNDSLMRSPTQLNGGVATAYINALAELEQGYADRDNRPGFIHCQPRVAQLWLAAFAVEAAPSGRYLQTRLGNIVVPDPGYPGSGAGLAAGTKAQSWVYMTGPVAYARTPTRLQVSSYGERMELERDAVGTAGGQNLITTRAECDLAVFWDSKVNVSILVDHVHDIA